MEGMRMLIKKQKVRCCLSAFALLAWSVGFCMAADSGEKNELKQAAADLRSRYAADLESLAKWCEAAGLQAEAAKTRAVLAPSNPYKLYIPILPDAVGALDALKTSAGTSAGASAKSKTAAANSAKAEEWLEKLKRLRQKQATATFELAQKAVQARRFNLAYSLAVATLRADPDHEDARKLFGFQNLDGRWRTAYEVKKLRAGNVWSEQFGWLPKERLERYQNGERYNGGRWITAEQDAARHRDIRNGWEIETEHYAIRSNHSIEAAVAFGEKLERLYRLWRHLFIRYYATDADVAAWFKGRSLPSPSTARCKVWLFPDRGAYNDYLRPSEPNIECSVGYYSNKTRTAYFFVGKKCDDRTIFHEATHQLFRESRPVAPMPGQNGNFWILEGVAMFMESLHEEDGFSVLGGFDDDRMKAARYRLLQTQFYIPFGDMVDYDMKKVQTDPKIAMLYSEMSGLTHFLLFYDGGRYREVLVNYLTAVYTGRANHDTLSKLCETDYETLDKQYREFMTTELK
jgi:hypothetical protein